MRKTKESFTTKKISEILNYEARLGIEGAPEKYDIPGLASGDYSVHTYVVDNTQVEHKGGRTKFMKIFQKECDILIKNKIIDFKEFGFLIFLGMTFTGYEDNALRNADDSLATQKDIIEASGMTRGTVSPLLAKMIDKNIIFEMLNPDYKNAKSYILNPMIFYRGKNMDRDRKEIYKSIEKNILDSWKTSGYSEEFIEANRKTIREAIQAITEIEFRLNSVDINQED